jgi:hypothetical protein
MSVLSRMGKMASGTAKGAYRAGTSRFGAAAIIAGAGAAAVLDSKPSNESMRGIMNSVIGTPEDGPGADEIILGRKLEIGSVFNPLDDLIPFDPSFFGIQPGPGWGALKYATQPGPGIGNPAIADYQGAMNKREAFLDDSANKYSAEMNFNAANSTFGARRGYGNLSASGDIVLGKYRQRGG